MFFLFLGDLHRDNDEADQQHQHQDPGRQRLLLDVAVVQRPDPGEP
jgi:hypothetical protein